jgi:uncharacterized cupin superfamily protein
MHKINSNNLTEIKWSSPNGKFAGATRQLSLALGRNPSSTDINERHPFDVEIQRISPGKASFPYHSHSAQWEFYHVIAGRGIARHQGGNTPIESGDTFLFKPGEPHQLLNDSTEELLILCVADNPVGESCHYPDSNKWAVNSPEYRVIRSDAIAYYDREE